MNFRGGGKNEYMWQSMVNGRERSTCLGLAKRKGKVKNKTKY